MNGTPLKPSNYPYPADPYQPMLQESIHWFMAEYRKGVTDFSSFSSIFSRLIQILPDPPLEIVWFYSALTVHAAKLTAQDYSSKRVTVVKELFQLLVSCSSQCGHSKRIAILAPVIYELYCLMLDKKNLDREVENLLEGVVSYSSICCGVELEEEEEGLLGLNSSFSDVLRVWMVDRTEVGDGLKVFFPLVSEEVRKGIGMGCGFGYLAGVVMCEALLLRLCLKFCSGNSRVELEKDVCNCTVQMITGFGSFWFLDTILKTLLEPNLLFTSLLSSKDDALLQEVLYDVVIRLGKSFLEPPRGIQLAGKHLKNLILTWTFTTETAIRSVRERGNQAKALSYINAFSESCLPSHLIKWVTNQTATKGKISKPNACTPVALLGWLLIVEDQGIKVFDCEISKLQAKAVICKSRLEYVVSEFKPEGKNLDENLLFRSTKLEIEDKFDCDLEMADAVESTFLWDDGMMKATAADGTRKRKEGITDDMELQVKFGKYHFHENSVKEKCLPMGTNDGLSSESEVDNPVPMKIQKI
ncbi:hypothetical protein I3843_16G031200 [Carya illinoinensis]|nr:hypothetical protein I3843_16G031200 [Carya illinoinensis]